MVFLIFNLQTVYASIPFDSVDHTLIMSEEEGETRREAISVHQDWIQLIKTTITKLYSIANNIQELERSIQRGSIICSSIGWFSGVVAVAGILGAPFTFGGSLSLTAVGTGIGLCSGAADILQSWASNSGIETKCNEAIALLKEITKLTTELANLVGNLNTLQNAVCAMMNTDQISLSALDLLAVATGIGCGSLVTVMSKNIPNIKSSSTTIISMVGGKASAKVSAPIFGKVTTEIAKKSLRFVGTVAVSISIITDFVNVVNNVRALKEGELSVVVTGIFTAIADLKDQRKLFDKLFAFTA